MRPSPLALPCLAISTPFLYIRSRARAELPKKALISYHRSLACISLPAAVIRENRPHGEELKKPKKRSIDASPLRTPLVKEGVRGFCDINTRPSFPFGRIAHGRILRGRSRARYL